VPGLAADPYAEALRHRAGQPAGALGAIQAEIRSANPEQLRAIEGKLLAIIEATNATPDAKSWACRTLRLAGSAQSVPTLAALLTDQQLAADAQFALRSIPGPTVDAALRAALPRAEGLLKAGIVQTLGARGDRQAVALIAPLASETDPVVAEAALYALGHIGGAAALQAVQAAQVPESLVRYRQHAVLLCADSLRAEGKAEQAAQTCRTLYTQSNDSVIRAGALRGLALSAPEAAAPLLAEALDVGDWTLRGTAARTLCEVAPEGVFTNVLGGLAAWAPDTQAMVLGLVTNPVALPLIRRVLPDANEEARPAALDALGRLGDATDVPALLAAAAKSGAGQPVARKALRNLRGPAVNDALVAAMIAASTPIRCEALRAVAARNHTPAVPALLTLAADAEPSVRSEARKALGQLAQPTDLPALLALLAAPGAGPDRETAEAAVAALVSRVADPDAACAPLLAALPGASADVRCALLRVLAQMPNAKSLEALRAALNDRNARVQEVAVRGLADWPEAAPMPDLLALARSTSNPTHRALALRGYIRLAALPSKRPPEQTVKLLREVLTRSPSADEQKAVLAALAGLAHVSALDLAVNALADPAVEMEATHAVVRLARKLQATDARAAAAAVQRILDTCKSPAARQLAESAGILLGGMVNIAPQGTASSPDDLDKDGAASGDQAAIDGNPDTYWDEADGAKLYRLVVTFKQPVTIAALSILGYAHHSYAPRTFQVRCDGKAVKTVENAQYTDNFLAVPLPETTCQTVELKITGYYGNSPAVRELGLYQRQPRKEAAYRVLLFSKTLGFRHDNIPLGASVIRNLGAEHGFAVDATEDSAVFTPTNLARYKAVVFLSVTGDVLNEAQQTAFKDYVLGGGGFAAIHGALFGPSACEEKWAWYGELCCATFKNHSAVVPAQVDIEDANNPSTMGLPARWSRTDEWYNYAANPRGCARVLATVDESTYKGGTLGADHPIAWAKRMGQGRVWYTAMGHTEESFREPLFLKHVVGGIELVAGVKPGDFAPNPKPVRNE
jgi:HEAT repeat protein/type 1 glutamine amidotransferase